MKIADVKIHFSEWERGPHHWRDEIMPSGATGKTALLRILTDEGIEGLSNCKSGSSIEEGKDQVVGENSLNRERIWQKLWRNMRSSQLNLAIEPVDCALSNAWSPRPTIRPQASAMSPHILSAG